MRYSTAWRVNTGQIPSLLLSWSVMPSQDKTCKCCSWDSKKRWMERRVMKQSNKKFAQTIDSPAERQTLNHLRKRLNSKMQKPPKPRKKQRSPSQWKVAKKTKRMPLRRKRKNLPNKQRLRSSNKRKKTRESKKRRLKSCKNPKITAWMKSISINKWPTSLKSSSQTLQLDRSEASKRRTKKS